MPRSGGMRFEQSLRAVLAQEGKGMIRSAGSRGAVDLVAHSGRAVEWIQAKSTDGWDAKDTKFVTRLADAAAGLLELELPPGSERWLYVHVTRQGWFRARVDGWPAGEWGGLPGWVILAQNDGLALLS